MKDLTGQIKADFDNWLLKTTKMSIFEMECFKGGKTRVKEYFIAFIDACGLDYYNIECEIFNVPRKGITSFKEMEKRVIKACIDKYNSKPNKSI